MCEENIAFQLVSVTIVIDSELILALFYLVSRIVVTFLLILIFMYLIVYC